MFKLNVNKDSQKKFDYDCGDVMSLEEFIDACKSGSFIDYDGFASEILLNGNVIQNDHLYPSDLSIVGHELLKLQKEVGPLEIVWYNR